MSRATHPALSPSVPPSSKVDGHVCPFCGLMREINEDFDPATPCPRCTLADTPTTRNATKARIGPWHVRQVRNPWAPGMRFETLLALIKRGQVNKDSIVRGPTSHQLWKRAAEVKGLSREFGLCYSCGREVSTTANLCPHCNRLQEPPVNPDLLVEMRDGVAASSAAAAPVAAPAPVPAPAPIAAPVPAPRPATPPRQPARQPAPQREEDDEPARLDMAALPVMSDPTEMLAVSEDPAEIEMARQIAARPPARQRTTPIRPRTPGADDALLTPQELAAAFQLDFSPTADGAQPPRRRGGTLLVLLLLAAGAGVLMYLRPDLRERASDWSDRTMASIQTFVAARTSPAQPATRATAPPVLTREDHEFVRPRQEPIVIAPPPAAPSKSVAVADPSPKAAPSPAVPKIEPPPPAPAPAPVPASARTETARPPAEEAVAPKPAPPPVEVIVTPPAPEALPAPTPPAPAEAPAPRVFDASQAYEASKQLWSKAIDAETNQDYVEAVNCYEQIKKLPADLHPNGLDVRLELARKLAK